MLWRDVKTKNFVSLPSHEGSGLKSLSMGCIHDRLGVSPRMRGVD